MSRRQIYLAVLAILAFPFLRVAPAYAHGDRVVPQVVDGAQSDGIKYRTKFDITNISPFKNTTITKATVSFYTTANGVTSPWTVTIKDPVTGNPTNVNSYTLNLGFSQTVRIETLGTGSVASGYAVIRNLEATSEYPDDRELSVTVYVEVSSRNSGGGYDLIDTISVPVNAPTVSWTFPVEIDPASGVQTGFAMVDVSGIKNNITIDLYQSAAPLSGDAVKATASYSTSLEANAKTVGFLQLTDFFPTGTPTKIKGVAVASSTSPLVFLALLQSAMPVANGVQFATLVPTNLDGLRRNTFMYLPQGYSLDADLMISDYFRDESFNPDPYYETPWDLLFQTGSQASTRYLMPQPGTDNGAKIAVIGIKGYTTPDPFDAITLEDLQKLNYSTSFIDLSDGTTQSQLKQGFTFAIKTGLGRYAKVRIRTWITYTGSDVKDLLLEIYTYR